MTSESAPSMTLYELIRLVNWPEVKAALGWRMHVSRDEIPPHRAVFRRIFTLKPEPSEFAIEIILKQSADGSDWLAVGGHSAVSLEDASPEIRESLREYGPDISFSLEFQPWTEWVGMTIRDATLAQFTPAEIVAACVYEMSFVSFDEAEIQSSLDYLKYEVDAINAETQQDTPDVTLPDENIFEALGFPPEEAAALMIDAEKRISERKAGKYDRQESDDEDSSPS